MRQGGSKFLGTTIGNLDTTILRAVQQPFGISQFLPRKTDSRPEVVPRGSTNLSLTRQFVEVPRDCVYTMEYSVRSAQIAVYQLLGLAKEPTPLGMKTGPMATVPETR
ncbi:MAG TPA: oleate hydratase [Sphingomicrobium sp.]|nr:oleate hydratase [Sphingomicrobium sp.]